MQRLQPSLLSTLATSPPSVFLCQLQQPEEFLDQAVLCLMSRSCIGRQYVEVKAASELRDVQAHKLERVSGPLHREPEAQKLQRESHLTPCLVSLLAWHASFDCKRCEFKNFVRPTSWLDMVLNI